MKKLLAILLSLVMFSSLIGLSETLYYAKVIDRTEPAEDLEKLAEEVSLKGLFVKKILERAQNADEEEKARLTQALKIGLAAFRTEVEYREDS